MRAVVSGSFYAHSEDGDVNSLRCWRFALWYGNVDLEVAEDAECEVLVYLRVARGEGYPAHASLVSVLEVRRAEGFVYPERSFCSHTDVDVDVPGVIVCEGCWIVIEGVIRDRSVGRAC